MRINQYIAHNSSYSRREVDRLIELGRVRVNKVLATAGQQVGKADRITIDSKPLCPTKHFSVIAYHKPKGEIVSKHDTFKRRIIFDSLPQSFAHFRTIGRLDFASEGLLLLTDSAKVADKLAKSNLTRSYYLKLCGKLTPAVFDAMEQGLCLDDARKGGHAQSKIVSMSFAPFVGYKVLDESKNYARMRVQINEGQNRELRRFFAAFGLEVLDLKRVEFGFVSLDKLQPTKWRFLNKAEYNKLHQFLEEVE